MKKLEKSRTYRNLRKAFAEEAELAFRYLYCATLADFEGQEKPAALFRELAEGGNCSAHGCLDFLRGARDPDSDLSLGRTAGNLEALARAETRQHNQTYPEMAKAAREEGLPDIASWFDTLEKAKRRHARRLKELSDE
ncbi:MAG: rubrerythrin [Elusimicrobia bacterium]|nr:rubrerythrin [Elusimicrobiota bacterium]